MKNNKIKTITFFTCLLLATQLFASELIARINTDKVVEGNAFQLTLSTTGQVDNPDLTPLQRNFEILGNSKSTSMMRENGNTSHKNEWMVTLLPKKAGEIIIPAIKAGALTSKEIRIKVIDASQAPKVQGAGEGISLTTSIKGSSEKFYVFQEISLTLRIEASKDILTGSILEPKVEGAELNQSGGDRLSQLVKNGSPINIIERDYILRPQKAGKISLKPFSLRGQVPNQRRQRNNPFGVESFSVRGNALTINVEGKSDAGSNKWFLPAKLVEMNAEWQPQNPTFKQGEAVIRKVKLLALGAQPDQLPKLKFDKIDGVKIYVDNDITTKIDTNRGTKAMREITLSIVPIIRAGEIILPEIKVDWFNTEKNELAVAILPSETIQVNGTEFLMTDKKPKVTESSESSAIATEKNQQPEIEQVTNQLNDWWASIKSNSYLAVSVLIATLALIVWCYRKRQLGAPDSRSVMQKKIRRRLDLALKSANPNELYQALLHWQNHEPMVKNSKKLSKLINDIGVLLYQKTNSEYAIDFNDAKRVIDNEYACLTKKYKKTTLLPKLYHRP